MSTEVEQRKPKDVIQNLSDAEDEAESEDNEAKFRELVPTIHRETERINNLIEGRNERILEAFLLCGLAKEDDPESEETTIEIDQDDFAKRWLAKEEDGGDEARSKIQQLFDGLNKSDIRELFLYAGCAQNFIEVATTALEEFRESDGHKERNKIRKRTKKALKKLRKKK